jgi:LmbE family N-acetylglucosaminyl deacetylase
MTDNEKNGEERQQEMCRAAAILGFKTPTFIGLPDGKMVVDGSIVSMVQSAIDTTLPRGNDLIAPDAVFVMWPVDVHARSLPTHASLSRDEQS